DVGDHDVHVRAGEATDELRECERNEDLPQGARGPSDADGLTHASPDRSAIPYLLAHLLDGRGERTVARPGGLPSRTGERSLTLTGMIWLRERGDGDEPGEEAS